MLTKERLEGESASATWSESFDTGYTKYCPRCCVRWAADAALINKERFLKAEVCSTCLSPKAKLKFVDSVNDDDDDDDDDE